MVRVLWSSPALWGAQGRATALGKVLEFPVAAVVYLWWRGEGVGRREWLGLGPFFVLSFLLGLVTLYFQHVKAIAGEEIPIGGLVSRMAVAGTALLFTSGTWRRRRT